MPKKKLPETSTTLLGIIEAWCKITCDKCGLSDSLPCEPDDAADNFYFSGWRMQKRSHFIYCPHCAKKYLKS